MPPGADPEFDDDLRHKIFRLLHEGTARSWRFLEMTGLLARVMPEVDEALQDRARDAFDLDPGGAHRFPTLEGLHALEADPRDPASVFWVRFQEQDLVRLAALARDAFDEDTATGRTEKLAVRLGLSELPTGFVSSAVDERHLLPAASRRLDMGSEDAVLELAAHLSSVALADALYVLAVAEDAMEPTERERLDELHGLVRQVLDHPELHDVAGGDILEKRRLDARQALTGLAPARLVRDHLEAAPARYLLAQAPEAIGRHIRMVDTRPHNYETRLEAEPGAAAGDWTVHLAFLDRHGALASVAGAFSSCNVSVHDAFISTWRSGVAIDVFKVTARDDVDWEQVRRAISARLEQSMQNGGPVVVEGTVSIDNAASPWHTLVEVRARDRTGLLYRVASALARSGANIHSAQVTTREGVAIDTFAVTGANGAKLDDAGVRALHLAFAGKSLSRLPGPLRRLTRAGRR
jgi:[protein-PII] uridylyltransferase